MPCVQTRLTRSQSQIVAVTAVAQPKTCAMPDPIVLMFMFMCVAAQAL